MIDYVKRLRQSRLYQSVRNSRLGHLLSPLLHAANVTVTAAFDLIYKKRGYRIKIGGTSMLVDPDYIMTTEISPEEPVLERLIEMIAPGETFLDVGGYIGTYAIPVAMKDPSIKVVSFEPAPHCAEVFKKHLRYNHVTNVTLVESACGDTTGTISFDSNRSVLDFPAPEGKTMRDCVGDPACENHIDVRVTRLDDYVEDNDLEPAFLKVDVEGAELQVLEGARKTLLKHKPTVFCELHKFNWADFACDEQLLNAFLDDVGFEMRDAVTEQPLTGMPERCQVVLRPAAK